MPSDNKVRNVGLPHRIESVMFHFVHQPYNPNGAFFAPPPREKQGEKNESQEQNKKKGLPQKKNPSKPSEAAFFCLRRI